MLDKLKAQWHSDPVGVAAVGAVVVTAAASLLNAVSAAQGRRAYAKQVNYRVKNSR